MLYLVLILVIVAFGLLIAALTTANTLFAWISVAISVLAAGLLIFDWLQGRRRVAATSTGGSAPAQQFDEVDEAEDTAPEPEPEQAEPTRPAEPFAAQAAPSNSIEAQEAAAGPLPEQDDEEPSEEETDAADLLVVSELTVEVRVVDEHPRYHLTRCTWLSGRPTIPITVAEARQLGFTPCARCGPDAVLAAKHRSTAGRGGTP